MGGKSALFLFQLYTFYALRALTAQRAITHYEIEDEHYISINTNSNDRRGGLLLTFIIFLMVYWGANVAENIKNGKGYYPTCYC